MVSKYHCPILKFMGMHKELMNQIKNSPKKDRSQTQFCQLGL